MKKSVVGWLSAGLGLAFLAACGDSSSGGSPQDDASTVDSPSGPDGGDGNGGDGSMSQCDGGPFVVPGAACSTNGSTATGPAPECTDVGHLCPVPATCTCTGGTWACPTCPHCTVDQHGLGCGAGQVCEGITWTQCDGTTREVAGRCQCTSGFTCPAETLDFGCADAGSDAGDASASDASDAGHAGDASDGGADSGRD